MGIPKDLTIRERRDAMARCRGLRHLKATRETLVSAKERLARLRKQENPVASLVTAAERRVAELEAEVERLNGMWRPKTVAKIVSEV